MTLSAVKNALAGLEKVEFRLPNGEQVPSHFHVTEIGEVTRRFIDCGGTVRKQEAINVQLYMASDYDHRLSAEKFRSIIELSESRLALEDLEIEVAYPSDTIGKYGLAFNGSHFLLTPKQTDCLVKDSCGLSTEKPRFKLSALGQGEPGDCRPGSGCC